MSMLRNPKSEIRKSLWGFTLVEVLVASTLSILVIFGTVMLFIVDGGRWTFQINLTLSQTKK